jgi:Protein of unknown function (DUF4038)/Domain of unknown function (DUF5060)
MSSKLRHVWEMQEVTLQATGDYENPYTNQEVWIDLTGPGFMKRIHGFWDGDVTYRVRFVATGPGEWSWVSGAAQDDSGLVGKSGSIQAIEWSEAERLENPCRRGFVRASDNGHAFRMADGTPFFYLADTWWATATSRYPWYDDDDERAVGPEMGFKDLVQYRKRQGFSGIAMIASFPTWSDDGHPSTLILDDALKTTVRAAWQVDGTPSSEEAARRPAKEMSNGGGRPFLFPGKVSGYEDVVPDFEHINPAYFRELDLKVQYLNDNGMIPFIEVARRDVTQVWKNYYPWPDSYARYIHYVYCRYHANNTLLSPIHFDYAHHALPASEMNEPANIVMQQYGPPPYDNPVSANAAPSTLLNFGGPDKAPWLTFHQIGNWREHVHFWHLTEIFRSEPTVPGVNGEPYYPGFPDDTPPATSEEANLNFRAGMYGGFLSGGLAGYIYGAEGMWGGNVEAASRYKIWDAIQFTSGSQVRHLRTFVMSQGSRYQELVPDVELVIPNKSGNPDGYRGWAYCAHTPDLAWVLCYFEKDCPPTTLRSLRPGTSYTGEWFNPRTGEWHGGHAAVSLRTDAIGRARVPEYPDDQDWALSLRNEEETDGHSA